MKAAVFYEHGPIENLQYADVPTPVPGSGEVLVRVHAAAINHLDLFVRAGMPGINLEFPHWGGSDAAGEVMALGAGVTGWQEGEHVVVNPSLWCGTCEYCIAGEESLCVRYRIIGEHVRGGAAEYLVVSAANLFRIPKDYPWEQAAAAPLVFMTAWRSLITQGQLRAGQSILILGAGGGVASAAIQIAKLAGATVYAASRDERKRQHARELGADHVLDSSGDFGKEIWRLTGKRGVDMVLENVGAATWDRSLRSVAKGGRVVVFGATSGPHVQLDLRQIFWKQYAIIGATMSNQREFHTVMRLVFWERRLHPVVDRILPLSEMQTAQRVLEAGEQFGKIVLVPAYEAHE
jgi:NADPH:quinone reductase-like Zn-dependent oxidoreductase